MATTNQQVRDLFNNCDLNADYEGGSLPNIDNAKLLRLAAALVYKFPEIFGTVAANVTADQFVVYLYNWLAAFTRSVEREIAEKAVAAPNEW